MAISNLFAEIDSALQKYVRADALEKQSKEYVHVVNYTPAWCENLLLNIMQRGLMSSTHGTYTFTQTQFDGYKKILEKHSILKNQVSQALTITEATRAARQTIDKAGFKVVTKGQYTRSGLNYQLTDTKLFKDGEPIGNYYAMEVVGRSLKVIYFINYPMHLASKTNVDADQKFASKLLARALLKAYKESKTFITRSDSRENLDKASNDPGTGRSTGFEFKRDRHHGGSMNDPTNPGMVGPPNPDDPRRSDTTVRLMDFLDRMKTEKSVFPNVSEMTPEYLDYRDEARDIINERFNSAYKISGYSNIDIFDPDEVALKEISIQIFVGDRSHSDLMSMADAPDPNKPNNASFDEFLYDLQAELMASAFGDPDRELSMSMTEMTRRGVFATIAKSMKTKSGMPDMRFKVNKQLFRDAQYEHKESKKRKGPGKRKTTKRVVKRGARGIPLKKGKKQGPRVMGVENNPLELEALLNKLLPKVVASKMSPPALQYRTGRFAQSVEVEDVMVGPRGGTQVNYTYMRDPYETFEPGNKQGSVYRDPRKIIGESVRAIAQTIMGDKFIKTRRV